LVTGSLVKGFVWSSETIVHRHRWLSTLKGHYDTTEDDAVVVLPSHGSEPPTIDDVESMAHWNTDDMVTYQANLQLAALADSASRNNRNVTAARLALTVLHSMQQPDTVAYNSVLKALAKVSPNVIVKDRTASDVAEALLRQMRTIHKRQVDANKAWYDALADGSLSDEAMKQGPPRVRVKPNVRSWSAVMDALGRTGDVEAAERAEALHKDLQSTYEASANEVALQPNLISYNTLLSAYANCGRPDKCHAILEDMPMAPDIISHNTILHALARSPDKPDTAGERAEAYLRNNMTSVTPNARSYSTCMDAYSRSGQPEKAFDLLQELMQAYRQTGRKDPALRPNAITYSTIIHGFSKSKDPQKAIRAYHVWQEMRKEGIQPNQVTLNSVLNACATTVPPTPLVRRIGQAMYQYSLKQGQPDEITFGIALKGSHNWMDDSVLSPREIFTEACRRGMVSPGVLYHLRQAVPSDAFRKIVGEDVADWEDLPAIWKDQVRHQTKSQGPRNRR
jgi:pentatricopeptide repeat protein